MSAIEKIVFRILNGKSDANLSFTDLVRVLKRYGFSERIKGSHHIFTKPAFPERITLQKDGPKAKPYQVRQIRKIITEYKLTEEDYDV